MSNTHLISSICLFVFTTVIAQLDVATKCGIPALADVNVCLGTSGKRYEVIVGPRVDSLTCDFQIFTSGNKADEDRNFPNIYLTAVNLGKNYDYSNARPKFEPELAKQPSRITDGQISTTTEITTYYLQYRGGLEDDAMPIWGNDTNGKEQQIPATPLKLKVGYQCVNDIPKVAIPQDFQPSIAANGEGGESWLAGLEARNQ
ncbi:uncharacterized protein KY384_006666 [Bacidia gigantensis]|uniref:uncharacterized protein n=1 Tax=Bacidia gigantensis TaxID=2732470 RepID=UPI001D0575BF|nr:uncharacterized protein KY384_006666 [Bacidia gigantensis]KAG8528977.1 hypothetical protein KY384_006666 [Bacidia gigantensis]